MYDVLPVYRVYPASKQLFVSWLQFARHTYWSHVESPSNMNWGHAPAEGVSKSNRWRSTSINSFRSPSRSLDLQVWSNAHMTWSNDMTWSKHHRPEQSSMIDEIDACGRPLIHHHLVESCGNPGWGVTWFMGRVVQIPQAVKVRSHLEICG